jgi:hypothetical protein
MKMQASQVKATSLNPQSLSTVKLARLILSHAQYVLPIWLPEGEISGDEYKALNPLREDKSPGSFSINMVKGVWADFASNDQGGSLVELFQYLNQIKNESQLIAELNAFCDEHGLTFKNTPRLLTQPPVKKKPPTEVVPVDEMNLLPPDYDVAGNVVTATWEYRTVKNEISFYTLRTEPEAGKKEVKPCRLSQGRWVWGYPEGKLPLFNCHKVEVGTKILFGEGEKTAAHLDTLGVGVGITSAGGSNRLLGSDLSPLKKGSEVIIFPDADEPGIYYATQVMYYCLGYDIPCQLLDVSGLGWDGGDDAADYVELAWSDYESHLITAQQWQKCHEDAGQDALSDFVAELSDMEFDRVAGKLAKALGIGKTTLKKERQSTLKQVHKDEEENDVDVSDIDLSSEEKRARRQLLDPIVAQLAHSTDILDQVVKICHEKLNVHNEETLIKLGYLCVVSRLLDGYGDRPVSLMLKGSSGSGKTHVIKQVLKLFRPNDTWIALSSISPKGLIYDTRSYRGKLLFMPECNQLVEQDSLLTQLVKTILTEGSITHLTVDTGDSRSPEGRVITKEGPIALILGTVRDYLDAELETRALSYYVDESHEQTRNIVLQAAARFADKQSQDEAIIEQALEQWLAFDEWLALSPIYKVAIPFYTQVIEPIEHMPVRYRRDLVEMVPGLIKASALIHQANRKVVDGVIEATREDYEHVRVMVNDFLYRVQADTLTPKMNQLLLIIYKKMPHEGQNIRGLTIKQSDLAMELGITQQAVSYNLNKLIEKGYLINVQEFQRKPPQLKLGPEFNEQLMNADKSILLSAEKLGL